MHSDETSKFGKHYEAYNAAIGKCQYLTPDMQEVFSGNTETQLNVLIDIFKELEDSLNKSDLMPQKNCLLNKNVMPGRHIVQKS